MRWYYRTLIEIAPLTTVELNLQGDAGWELVGFTQINESIVYVFKKPAED